ncbi:mannose-1-phosphate guanylyltransferase [Thermanaerovibrio velox DSM 12556]|uniref:Mannose-1-phosphate guanylyltransferase n=1 Tax=Thermanaerovibrio velox DSM 12556 TaxID=926567 RepID=H0UN05_9BACT|nr:sugar phosphate nucleotidyltransferase [Thermanaerovibrio velox]EHM09284.1 mannose-1-phosphate guanylyltransferase [Thermanaerovibrio velox DSM 12556]
MKAHGILLAGGGGTRLWPLSRGENPKQFMPLGEGPSLLADAFRRALSRVHPSRMVAVTSQGLGWKVRSHLLETPGGELCPVIEEPCRRNTLPAVLAGVLALRDKGARDGDVVFVLPCDHVVGDQLILADAMDQAAEIALAGYLVTFGVEPGHPETGYGYIKTGEPLRGLSGHAVERFEEKPPFERAKAFLEEGGYLWNSGMFCFSLGTFMEQLELVAPSLWGLAGAGLAGLLNAYKDVEPLSFDKGLLEGSHRVAVVPLKTPWSDVGSWDSVYQVTPKDQEGNASRGSARFEGCRGCLAVSSRRRLVLMGLEDVMVVDGEDAVLVIRRGLSQRVGQVAEEEKGERARP